MNKIIRKLILPTIITNMTLTTKIKFNKIHLNKPNHPKKNTIPPITYVWQEIKKTSSTNNFVNINKIATLIQSLDKKQRESAIKFLMATLYKQQIDQKSLNDNHTLQEILKDYPFLQIQTANYLINQYKAEYDKANPQNKQQLLNNINDLFLISFEKYLPNAKQAQLYRSESLLFKSFGKHMLQIGNKQKGLTALSRCIQSHRNLVRQQYQNLQQFNKKREQSAKQKEKTKVQKQRQSLQANAMKQNIRRLIESMFESLFLYYSAKRQDIRFTRQKASETESIILDIVSLISDSMKLKSIVPGIRQYSRYYHRLMRISLQLQYAYVLRKNPSRIQLIQKLMKQFYKESIGDLEQMTGYLQIQKQIALAMMAIKLHLSRSQKKNIKDQLVNCSQFILERGKFQTKTYKANMMKLLGQFIKKNTQ